MPPFIRSAARRAQWLGELRQALDDANRLALHLRGLEPTAAEAARLHQRIVALKAEVDSLQRARPPQAGANRPKRIG